MGMTKEKECITIIGGTYIDYDTDIVCKIVDKEGLHWDNVATWLWCGIFGFCGCGDIQYDILKIYKTLKMYSNNQLLPFSLQIYAYILDKWEFTEHGSSIFSAVLTKKGEALLYLLEQETKWWHDVIKSRNDEDARLDDLG
jgi:hypothetical protein